MKPIAVLGCGPAGLLAAHGVGLTGQPVALFSVPNKSVLGGAQFLHKPIPALTEGEPDIEVTFRVVGDAATYQDKVYGPGATVPFVSISDKTDGDTQPAWNLLKIYDGLWNVWERSVQANAVQVTPEWLEEEASNFKAIISTIPLPALCKGNHHFGATKIQIQNECIMGNSPDNTVHYNGTKDTSWYRCSKLFGIGSTEWNGRIKLPYPNLVGATKPIRSNCDCWPDVIKVGRFGAWKKGELTHDAFFKTLRALHERGIVDLKGAP